MIEEAVIELVFILFPLGGSSFANGIALRDFRRGGRSS
jgi:hypothetical protein